MKKWKTHLYVFVVFVLIASLYVLKGHAEESSINVYAISDADMLSRYTNGHAGEDELRDYFYRTTNKLLLSLSAEDINSITISKKPNSLNTDAEISLNARGKKKIEVINKHYLNKIVFVAFNSNFVGSCIVIEEVDDGLTLSSRAIGQEENLKLLRDISSKIKVEQGN
jgi:hypothetical protein